MATDSLMLQTVSECPASDIRYQASISIVATGLLLFSVGSPIGLTEC